MTSSQLYKKNQNDFAVGIRLKLDRGVDGRPMSQSQLSHWSGVSNDVVSKVLNPDKNRDYSPTLRTISKIISVFNMTFQEFFEFVEEETKGL